MHRLAVFLLAILALGMGGISMARAEVRHYEKLSMAEQVALQVSEQRVALYDQELARLDQQRHAHRISSSDYQFKSTTLVYYIQLEAQFQNAILVHKSDLPQNAKDVLETMGHGVLMVPIGLGYVVAACPQLLEFLTMIH